MINKLFSILPLFMTISMTAGLYFITDGAYPKEEWQQTSQVSTAFLKDIGFSNLEPVTKELPNLEKITHAHFQENAKLENQTREYLFKINSIKNQFTNKTTLSYKENFLTIHSHYLSDVAAESFHDSLTQKIKMHLDATLKGSLNKELHSLEAKIKNTNSEIFKLNESASENENTTNTQTEVPNTTEKDIAKSIPADIRSNLKMFKDYKEKKEARFKEIDDIIANMPHLGSTPLVMLSSNLYHSYLNQKQALETKLTFLQIDSTELLDAKTIIANLENKIDTEEKRLRDESHYLKGERDKALRLKKHALLQEKENLKDTLLALNEFQKILFQQDQPQTSQHPIQANNTRNTQENQPKVSDEEKTKELNLLLNKLNRQKENLISVGVEINEKGLTLENQKVKIKQMSFYSDKFVLMNSVIFVSVFWLLTALLFGTKSKITKGEHAAHLLKTPYLGAIPTFPNLGLENAKNKRLTDAIDLIAKKILDQVREKNAKSISIISLDPQDGRTQLTGMLALSLNLNNEMKIITMDAHFSKPTLKDFLELKNKALQTDEGIISYLEQLDKTKEITENENNQWLAKLVKPCVKNGIFVISPGKGTLTNPDIFNAKAIDTMSVGLAKYVDLIIFDTPPIHSNESNIAKTLIDKCDGSILILKKGHNTIKQIESLKKEFQSSKLLGIVFKA